MRERPRDLGWGPSARVPAAFGRSVGRLSAVARGVSRARDSPRPTTAATQRLSHLVQLRVGVFLEAHILLGDSIVHDSGLVGRARISTYAHHGPPSLAGGAGLIAPHSSQAVCSWAASFSPSTPQCFHRARTRAGFLPHSSP